MKMSSNVHFAQVRMQCLKKPTGAGVACQLERIVGVESFKSSDMRFDEATLHHVAQ